MCTTALCSQSSQYSDCLWLMSDQTYFSLTILLFSLLFSFFSCCSIYPIPDPLGSSEPHLPTATNPRLPLQAHSPLPHGTQHLPQDARKNGRLDSPQHNDALYKSSPKSVPLNLAQFRDSPDEQSGPVLYNIEFSSSDPLSRGSAVLTNSSVSDTLPSSLPHSNTSPKLIPHVQLCSPSKSPLVSSPSPPPQTDEGDKANNMDDAYLYFQ